MAKVRISDYDLCRVGTVAHNKDFTIRDLSEYLGKDAGPMVRSMVARGMAEQTTRGRYFPTKTGWRDIENACEGSSRELRGAKSKRIAIQVLPSGRGFTVEPLEQVGEDAWDESTDYEYDRQHFKTWKVAVDYAKSLVADYKDRGDGAWWVDAR